MRVLCGHEIWLFGNLTKVEVEVGADEARDGVGVAVDMVNDVDQLTMGQRKRGRDLSWCGPVSGRGGKDGS